MSLQKGGFWIVLIFFLGSCVPPEQVELREIRNLKIASDQGHPVVSGEVILFNPNRKRVKLKDIAIDLFVEGDKAAEVHQTFNQLILPESEFSVPVQINLSMNGSGALSTLFGLFGGRRYKVLYKGYIRISRNGLPIKIPIDYEDELRFN